MIYAQKIRLLIAFLLCINLHTSFAQIRDMKFEHLTIKDGLSHNAVGAIAMDDIGFMWFGTFDGLNKFDGYDFKIYKHNPKDPKSIGANRVAALWLDSKRRLWVGTRGGGLNLYRREVDGFKMYKNNGKNLDNTQPSSNDIRAICEDVKGNLWLATSLGLNYFEPETERFIHFINEPGSEGTLNSNNVSALLVDNKRNIWVGTFGHGVNILAPESRKFEYIIFNPVKDYLVTKLFQDSDGDVWVATEFGGAYCINPETKNVIHYDANPAVPNSLNHSVVRDIIQDSKGNIWLATDGGGLNILDKKTGTMQYFSYDEANRTSLSNPAAYSLFRDNEGIYWIGTVRGGVNIFKEKNSHFGHYKHKSSTSNSLIFNNVLQMAVDKNNNIWIGTDGGGLDFFDGTNFKHYNNINSGNTMQSTAITAMLVSKDQKLYIGEYGKGMSILDIATDRFSYIYHTEGVPNTLSKDNIRALCEDSEGNIWIGVEADGINKYNPQTGEFVYYRNDTQNPNSLTNNYVSDIIEDEEKNIWIATQGGGLNFYEKSKNSFFAYRYDPDDDKSIAGDYLRSLHIDSDGHLWIGLDERGFNLFHKESSTFTRYDERNGLSNNTVLSIEEDQAHFLWLSTNKGLSKFNPKTKKFQNFDEADGLQGDQFLYKSSAKGMDNKLYFGGLNGFNAFYPDSIKTNKHIPELVITSFKLFNKLVKAGDIFDRKVILEKSIYETKHIKLKYYQNSFSFEFVALDYQSPMKNKYKYMLIGFDADWVEASANQRVASYTNLDPGTYTFKVIASNSNDVWNTHGVSITVEIVPPFWRTWWFYSILLISILSAIVFYVKFREGSLASEKLQLEKKVERRTAEISKQNKEITEQKEEILRRIEKDRINNWINKGLAIFSEILSQSKNDIHKLSRDIVRNLVLHLEACQAAICVYNDRDKSDIFLEIIAAYAYEEKKFDKHRIELYEGLTGSCYTEQKTIYINNLPDDYTRVESGLGESKPKSLLLVPLKLEDIVFGVIELSSFKELHDFEIEFVQKLAQNITSSIYVVKMNSETQELLNQSNEQAEQLKAHEEELRQNMEEMQATQEDFARREIELIQENEQLKRENTKLLRSVAELRTAVEDSSLMPKFDADDSK